MVWMKEAEGKGKERLVCEGNHREDYTVVG